MTTYPSLEPGYYILARTGSGDLGLDVIMYVWTTSDGLFESWANADGNYCLSSPLQTSWLYHIFAAGRKAAPISKDQFEMLLDLWTKGKRGKTL